MEEELRRIIYLEVFDIFRIQLQYVNQNLLEGVGIIFEPMRKTMNFFII
jgi:hypothetical protein